MEPTRIIYLEAENVKRLKAIRLNPDKTLVRIEGKNAQGKTSVLDAIAAALGGGEWTMEKAVRTGEKKARVYLDLGPIRVERRWTASGGTTLEVTSSDDIIQKSPQAILDKLVGDLTFDPLAFVKMRPKEQADVLKRIAGIDIDAMQEQRKGVFEERTHANRRAKDAEARVGLMPPRPSNHTTIVVADLIDAQQKAIQNNAKIADLKRSTESAEATIRQQDDALNENFLWSENEAKRLKEELRQKLAGIDAAHEEFKRKAIDRTFSAREIIKTNAKQLESLAPVDATVFASQIKEAETHNRAITECINYDLRNEEAKKAATIAESLSEKIAELDDKIERAIRDAKYPLEGLSVDVSGVLFNGIPLGQASAAEQLRIGVAIGLAQKPQCRVILCRDGSLLDSASMEALAKIAEENDAQVFIERVADTASPSAVFIEDGEIVECGA